MSRLDSYPDELRRADDETAAAAAGHVYRSGSYDLDAVHGVFRQALRAAYESSAADGSAQTLAHFGRKIMEMVEPQLNPEGGAQ